MSYGQDLLQNLINDCNEENKSIYSIYDHESYNNNISGLYDRRTTYFPNSENNNQVNDNYFDYVQGFINQNNNTELYDAGHQNNILFNEINQNYIQNTFIPNNMITNVSPMYNLINNNKRNEANMTTYQTNNAVEHFSFNNTIPTLSTEDIFTEKINYGKIENLINELPNNLFVEAYEKNIDEKCNNNIEANVQNNFQSVVTDINGNFLANDYTAVVAEEQPVLNKKIDVDWSDSFPWLEKNNDKITLLPLKVKKSNTINCVEVSINDHDQTTENMVANSESVKENGLDSNDIRPIVKNRKRKRKQKIVLRECNDICFLDDIDLNINGTYSLSTDIKNEQNQRNANTPKTEVVYCGNDDIERIVTPIPVHSLKGESINGEIVGNTLERLITNDSENSSDNVFTENNSSNCIYDYDSINNNDSNSPKLSIEPVKSLDNSRISERYTCDICDKQYRRKGNLRSHKRKVHKIEE